MIFVQGAGGKKVPTVRSNERSDAPAFETIQGGNEKRWWQQAPKGWVGWNSSRGSTLGLPTQVHLRVCWWQLSDLTGRAGHIRSLW